MRRAGVNYPSFPVLEARPMPPGQLDAILDILWENIRWGRVLVAGKDGTSRAASEKRAIQPGERTYF